MENNAELDLARLCVFVMTSERPLSVSVLLSLAKSSQSVDSALMRVLEQVLLQAELRKLSDNEHFSQPDRSKRLAETAALFLGISCGLVNSLIDHECAVEALLQRKFDREENIRLAFQHNCDTFFQAPAVQNYLNNKVWQQARLPFLTDMVLFVQFLALTVLYILSKLKKICPVADREKGSNRCF